MSTSRIKLKPLSDPYENVLNLKMNLPKLNSKNSK